MAKESVLEHTNTGNPFARSSTLRMMRSTSFLFSATLTFWSVFSFVILFYVVAVLAKLDISFFESNGMIQNPILREAFMDQIFNIDPVFFGIAGLGIFSVGLIAFIFTRSQHHYFEKLKNALNEFAETGKIPELNGVGAFNPHVHSFFRIIEMKMKKEDATKVTASVEAADAVWPRKPSVSWGDQSQFVLVSAFIAAIFNVTGMIFFLQVNKRVVDLSNQLIRFKIATGPSYFIVKEDVMWMVMWPVFMMMTCFFIATGFRLGRKISDATYAILRDLRVFMMRDMNQKLFLRRGDPGQELIDDMNQSLATIRRKIQ